MRVLQVNELEMVAGGGDVDAGTIADAATITAALSAGAGMGIGQWLGMSPLRQTAVAAYFGFANSALVTSFLSGYAVGQWLNKNTEIQSWAADFIGQGEDGDG